MKNIIGAKRTEVVNSWRRRYFGVSVADNECRSEKIPTPGEKGLSELLFCASVPRTTAGLGSSRLTRSDS